MGSHEHCGSCGNECLLSEDCIDGECVCKSYLVMCNGTCVEPSTFDNSYNCLECGAVCPPKSECTPYGCRCMYDGQEICDGECVSIYQHPLNCGVCGTVCNIGGICVNGTCCCPVITPDVCNDTCLNLDTDNQNCGSCGTECTGYDICIEGVCTYVLNGNNGFICQDNEVVCGDVCCPEGQSCEDLNCTCNIGVMCNGTCCNEGDACINGTCVIPPVDCPEGTVECNGGCCPAGFICEADVCVCHQDNVCNESCCDPEVQDCVNGHCVLKCDAGLVYCNGVCCEENQSCYLGMCTIYI